MDPSAFPWWGWFIACGAVLLVGMFAQNARDSEDIGCIGVLAILAAAYCGIVGVVLMIRWIWIS